MGLNRMMMKNEVKVVDDSKFWDWNEADNITVSFTVPPGIKRIKVFAQIRVVPVLPGASNNDIYASIKNKMTNKKWGEGWRSRTDFQDIDSIVGVTPNKTYELLFNCYYTNGVTFSWSEVINKMNPTVEDY